MIQEHTIQLNNEHSCYLPRERGHFSRSSPGHEIPYLYEPMMQNHTVQRESNGVDYVPTKHKNVNTCVYRNTK